MVYCTRQQLCKVHRPVFQEECCRWSGWFHSLDGRAATGRCCKFPSFLWAECPSSLRRLSYTRDTASCRPGDKRHMSVDTHGALRTRQINTKQVRADKIHIDPVMRLCLCHQVTKPLLRSISIKKRSCCCCCVVSYTLKVFLTPYAIFVEFWPSLIIGAIIFSDIMSAK